MAVQSSIVGTAGVVEVQITNTIAANNYLWTDQAAGAEIRLQSASGLLAGNANVRIGVAEFGGVLTTNDYLLLTDQEIVKVVELTSTDIQSLIITDGGDPESVNFKVESTTGNTYGSGDLTSVKAKLVMVDLLVTLLSLALLPENTLTINGKR